MHGFNGLKALEFNLGKIVRQTRNEDSKVQLFVRNVLDERWYQIPIIPSNQSGQYRTGSRFGLVR